MDTEVSCSCLPIRCMLAQRGHGQALVRCTHLAAGVVVLDDCRDASNEAAAAHWHKHQVWWGSAWMAGCGCWRLLAYLLLLWQHSQLLKYLQRYGPLACHDLHQQHHACERRTHCSFGDS